MKKIKKRILALTLALTFVFNFNSVVYASSFSESKMTQNDLSDPSIVSTYSVGSRLASNTVVGKRTVTVPVYLSSANTGVYFRAGATSNPDGEFSCYVEYPDGTICPLAIYGQQSAGGTYLPYALEKGTAPAGWYYFVFTISNDTTTGCVAIIYDEY